MFLCLFVAMLAPLLCCVLFLLRILAPSYSAPAKPSTFLTHFLNPRHHYLLLLVLRFLFLCFTGPAPPLTSPWVMMSAIIDRSLLSVHVQ